MRIATIVSLIILALLAASASQATAARTDLAQRGDARVLTGG